jgi:hypothetical protein
MSGYDNGNGNTALAQRTERIENRIDRQAVGAIAVSIAAGGVNFQSVIDLMEFAKLMAISGICVPKHLRNEPGACLAICMQAVEWRMSPYAVANKSYSVNDRIAYESQLIHAVIEQRAPLKGRLRTTYAGAGETRTCTVTGHIKGEDEPLVFTSAPFGHIQPKNSPLWKSKPDLQLFYNASRDWARMYFPDLILGVYSSDEIEPATVSAPRLENGDRTAALAARFAPAVVAHPTAENQVIDTSDGDLPPDEPQQADGPDVSGADTEPPADALPDLSTFEKFQDAMAEWAMEHNVDPPRSPPSWPR